MKSQQNELVNAARAAENKGIFNYGKDYPEPMLYPLQGDGKFHVARIQVQALKAQEKERTSKANLRRKIEAKLKNKGTRTKLNARQDTHISAAEKTSSLSASIPVGPRKKKIVPDKYLEKRKRDSFDGHLKKNGRV